MYSPLRNLLLRLLAAPSGPPEPPVGSPGSALTFRASPRYLTLKAIHVAFVGLLTAMPEALGLIAAIANASVWQIFALSLVLAVALVFTWLHWFVVRLDYDMRHYVVTDRSLCVREGALVIRESTFTFANVQNVSVQQGPIDRLVGVSNVRIDTAGGGAANAKQSGFSGHRGVLAGIENGDEVRDRILGLLKAYRDAGLGDREDAPARHAAGTLSPSALERLREVRDEVRNLCAVLEARPSDE